MGEGEGAVCKNYKRAGLHAYLVVVFFCFFFFFLRYYANNYCHKVALSRYIETFILSLSQRHGPLEESVWTSTLTFIIKFQPLSQATGSVWERSLYIARGGVGGVSDDFGSVTKNTWSSPRKALQYSYDPLHWPSIFHSHPFIFYWRRRLISPQFFLKIMWKIFG